MLFVSLLKLPKFLYPVMKNSIWIVGGGKQLSFIWAKCPPSDSFFLMRKRKEKLHIINGKFTIYDVGNTFYHLSSQVIKRIKGLCVFQSEYPNGTLKWRKNVKAYIKKIEFNLCVRTAVLNDQQWESVILNYHFNVSAICLNRLTKRFITLRRQSLNHTNLWSLDLWHFTLLSC